MTGILGVLCYLLVVALQTVHPQEQAEHRDFQYNSAVDPLTGRYNFAYDTGHDNDIAHSLHMQYQDANGIVRGRYGYTDPRGKLRMVEYEAGPDGFVARGDVGPDQAPHDQAPASGALNQIRPDLSSYSEPYGNDLDLDPAPVQMAGWDPEADPMGQANGYPTQDVGTGSEVTDSQSGDPSSLDPSQFMSVNVTSPDALSLYGPELGFYDRRYPRIIYTQPTDANRRESEDLVSQEVSETNGTDPIGENNRLNIYNIDVDPNEIRQVAGSELPQPAGSEIREVSGTETPQVAGSDIRRDADGSPSTIVRRSGTRNPPVRVQASYSTSSHDHDAEIRSQQTHDHDAEIRRHRQAHDHDAETRSRQSHDHDAEIRARQTHEHDAERRYRATHEHDAAGRYLYRPTHDHAAERRYYRYRYTHDHDAERYHNHAADRAVYYRNGRYYNYPRRIFYRDSHSMEPHEHYDNPVYRNYRDHQHSDQHLYRRSRNNIYPATVRSSQLQYIPSDKYHDKQYYWT